MDIRLGLLRAAIGILSAGLLAMGMGARADELQMVGASASPTVVVIEMPSAVDLLELSSFACGDGYLDMGFSPLGYVICLTDDATAYYDPDVDEEYEQQCEVGGGAGSDNGWLAGGGEAVGAAGSSRQQFAAKELIDHDSREGQPVGEIKVLPSGETSPGKSVDPDRPVSTDSIYAPWESNDICDATCSEIYYADLAVLTLPSTTHYAVTVLHAEQKIYFDLVMGPVGDPCGFLPDHEFFVNVCYQEVGNPPHLPPAQEGSYLMPPLHCGASGSGDLPVGGGLSLH